MADQLSETAALILISLADAPRHGTAILDDIKVTSGRTVPVGTLYGTLDRLIGDGFVESAPAEGRRRPYRITQPGAAALGAYLHALRATLAVAERRLGGPALAGGVA